MKKFLLGLVFVFSLSAGGIIVAQNTFERVAADPIHNDKNGEDCVQPGGYCGGY